jgi:hypothetical protein
MWDDLIAWLGSLGEEYGVDPLIYAILYVGSAPFFFGSLAWLIRSIRRRDPLVGPALSTAFFFSLPTLYVFVAGRNLPPWVYPVLIGLAIIGGIDVMRRLRGGLRRPD